MAERGGECARGGGAELEAMQAPPLSALHGGSGRVRAAMLAKRSATEMEEGDNDGGDDEGGDVPSDVAEHRRWLSDLRADYTERLSLASFVSSEVASPSDDGEPDGEPRSSLMTRSSLDLDVDFSDEGDAAARWSPTTAAPLRRHSCPDGRLGGWRLADRAGGRADRADGRADRADVGLGGRKLADELVDAFGGIRVCPQGDEPAANAKAAGQAGVALPGGSVRCIFAIEMVREQWLNNSPSVLPAIERVDEQWLNSKPPMLRRQHKIRRLSPKDLSRSP